MCWGGGTDGCFNLGIESDEGNRGSEGAGSVGVVVGRISSTVDDGTGVLLTNCSNALFAEGVSSSNVVSIVVICFCCFCGCFRGREGVVSSISKSTSSEEELTYSSSTEFSVLGLKSEEEGDELLEESSSASFLFLFVRFWGCFVGGAGVDDGDSIACLFLVGTDTFARCLGVGEEVCESRGCVFPAGGGF